LGKRESGEDSCFDVSTTVFAEEIRESLPTSDGRFQEDSRTSSTKNEERSSKSGSTRVHSLKSANSPLSQEW
jgi:hypothetical protein